MKKIYIPPYKRRGKRWNKKGHYRKPRPLGKTVKVSKRKLWKLTGRDKSGQITFSKFQHVRE